MSNPETQVQLPFQARIREVARHRKKELQMALLLAPDFIMRLLPVSPFIIFFFEPQLFRLWPQPLPQVW